MAAYNKSFLDLDGLNALWARIKALFVPNTRKVNGHALSADVTVTAADVSAVRYDTNAQGLTDTQKGNARTNIGAGTSNLTIGTTSSTAAAGDHTHKVKINGSEKTIAASNGTAVDLGTYLTAHQTIKQDGVTGATVNRFGTCSTAAGTAAKTVSITTGTFSLEAGATVAVKFSNKNTANNPTLAVGSTAAKNIFVNGAQITTNSGQKGLLAGTVIFIYDGTQYHLIGNYYDSNSTGYATQFSLGALSSNTVTYTNFASMSIANAEGNGEAQIILASGTGIGGTNMGTWHITVSNRGSTASTPKATMTVRCLNKQSQESPPEFGYYYDTTNSLIYFGVKSPGYRGNNTITVLSNNGATLKDFGDVTTAPTGWTAATITEYSTTGHNHDSTYLKLSGGTMTGKINAWASQYTDDGTTGAIDMKNSNIVGLNSIYTCDASDGASEGIHFFRSTGKYDTLWMNSGHIYFVPNRDVGTSTNAASSKKVAILPASITSDHVVVTDGTSGDVKGVDASTLTVGVASKLGTADKGTSTKPIYLAAGVPTECSSYAGGTAVTLNNSSKAGSTASFYAPTAGGTANYVLIGNGTTSAPTWAEKAPKATAADSATNDANGNTISTNAVYYVAGTTDYPAWVANHAYAVNDNVISGGKAYYCKTAHTSGSSFDSSKWTAIATPVIKGTVSNVTALFTGMKIALKWPITGGSSSTYLNINNLGNVYIRRNNGNTTTHLPANTVCFLTYDGTYWQWADWDSNSTYSGMVDAYLNNAADAAKSASSTNFKLSSGTTIMLANNVANTKNAALTLNVNGTGAKTLYINGSASSVSNYTIPVGTFPCYYDGTNWYLWTDGTFQVSQLRYRAMLGEHQATMRYHIQVNNTGSSPKGWCSILRVTKTSGYGSYDSLRVHGILYDGNGNWEYQQERRIEFQAIVNISSNTANLYLGKTTLTADNWIRLVKVADRDYELQYNAATANYDMDVYYQYEGNASAYVTRYTTYTATTVSGTAITSEKLLSGSIAYRADADGDGNNIKATYFKSSGNVTLVSGTATKIGTQNGTDVKLTLPTIPAAANNGALKIGLNGGTATSKFTANQSGDSTLTFATGSAAGKISVDGTDVAVNGWSDKADKSSTVSTVAWDSTNKKITKTINGSTTDVVTAATLKTAMSLDNVNNTSDADKPVSTAQQTALDKKVNIANVDITSQSTTILALVQAMATSQIHYKRFYTSSDGGSSTISDKPTGSTNGGFMLEAYCNRYVSSSDWRYVLLCYVQASRPRIAWVTNSSTSISWSDFNTDTHYTTHLYAGDGTAANVATTNGNTKLTAVDNSTVRNTVTLQGSNNVSVSSDANGVVTIDGTHTHTTSLAQDSGTATVTLTHNQTYKLTAGGTSVLFKTPTDSNTDTLVKANKVTDTTAYKILASKTADPQGAATEANYAASCTINGAGTMDAVAYSVNSKCTLQFNTTTNALDFVFN